MASTLPVDVWSLILQHVPVADRLQHCALVCKKLSQAAAAATVALKVSLQHRRQEQQQQLAEAFASYLQHHGSHLTSLVLGNGGQALTQLLCPKLVHLDVSSARPVQLGLPGVLDSATGLTYLNLSSCAVTPDGGLSRLSVPVDLRHLQMQSVRPPGGRHVSLPGCVLPSLKHLTCLHLSQIGGVADVHHVSGLTNLSVLHIQGVDRSRPVRLTPSIAPGFVLPASLQQLCLGERVVLDPAVLAAATQLTCVELVDLHVEGPGGGVSSGAALLAAVAGLQQLDTLLLRDLHLQGMVWPAPSAAYAALTASSKLQKLEVWRCGVPTGAWEHAFPPARCCSFMREFVANEDENEPDLDVEYWNAAAVSSLVRCCPGLQDLELRLSGVRPVAALKPLVELTRLKLWVDLPAQSGNLPAFRAVVRHAAALTNLQVLDWQLMEWQLQHDEEFDFVGGCTAALLPLAGLRQLTDCRVELDCAYSLLKAENQAGPGQPPDVWLQVFKRCLKASNCQPAVIAVTVQLAKQQAEQQQQITALQQQVAALPALQAQNALQQQRRAEQEQQIAALQAQNALQEQRVAQLQAQVQQLMQLMQSQPEQH